MFLLRVLCVILGAASLDVYGQVPMRAEPRERQYTPKIHAYRPPQPKPEQPRHVWTKAPEREPELVRCDELRRRYESAMRAESRTQAERKAIYQQQVHAGC